MFLAIDQHPALEEVLRATGSAEILCCAKGIGRTWGMERQADGSYEGANLIGKMLMEKRHRLVESTPSWVSAEAAFQRARRRSVAAGPAAGGAPVAAGGDDGDGWFDWFGSGGEEPAAGGEIGEGQGEAGYLDWLVGAGDEAPAADAQA